ncbi:MAG TPA: DUF362 domain-containing protein [Dehalococcoidia bacterium]|nr:DUF362 domain-containing protein [Dehalococcoidia bacterium]
MAGQEQPEDNYRRGVVNRREFIKGVTAFGGLALLSSFLPGCVPGSDSVPAVPVGTTAPSPGTPYLSVARGESPKLMVQTALKALGGIECFVRPDNDVIIKPNICTAYHSYEYAVTTNPEVVAALVELCLGAGARRVRVLDRPFGGQAKAAYERSGIGPAVSAAGGEAEIMTEMKYREVEIPRGRDISKWTIYGDVLDADVLINVPIAKDHSLARLTLGMKNLLGVVHNRNQFHVNLGQRIADLTTVVQPSLTVVDAVRILVDHGPSSGSLDDVRLTNTVIASHDIVAADAYAATLFGFTGADIPATRIGAEMGLGTLDLDSVKVEEISV